MLAQEGFKKNTIEIRKLSSLIYINLTQLFLTRTYLLRKFAKIII